MPITQRKKMKPTKQLYALFFLILLFSTPASAEQLSWQELNAKVTGYYQQQQYSTAVKYAEEALSVARKSGSEEEIATSLKNLGEISTHLGKYVEAEEYIKESIYLRQSLFGPDGLEVALSWRSLGFTYFLSKNMADAEMCFEEVLRIQVKHYGEKGSEIIPALQRLEKFYKYTKNTEKERALTERILNLQTGPE